MAYSVVFFLGRGGIICIGSRGQEEVGGCLYIRILSISSFCRDDGIGKTIYCSTFGYDARVVGCGMCATVEWLWVAKDAAVGGVVCGVAIDMKAPDDRYARIVNPGPP